MEQVNIIINGKEISAEKDLTVLEVAEQNNIHIPTLCFLKKFQAEAMCRVCMVEIKGYEKLMPACSTRIVSGMEIETDSEQVLLSRRKTVDLICEHHRMECDYCSRYTDCELHALVGELGLDDRKYLLRYSAPDEDVSSPCIIRDFSKCVQCRRCEHACAKQTIYAIGALQRGAETKIGSVLPLPDTGCVGCGQCFAVCPTGALSIRDDTQSVWNALRVSKKHVIAILSPIADKNIGRILHAGEAAEGKLISFLRKIGFEKIYDQTVGKDAVTRAEQHVWKGETLISSKCPAAFQFCQRNFPQLKSLLSLEKDASRKAAEICRKKFAAEKGINPNEVIVVLISPCTASKTLTGEDIDIAITTREMLKMIHHACVSRFTMVKVWRDLPQGDYDFCGETENANSIESMAVSGLNQVRAVLEEVSDDPAKYRYVEISACPPTRGSYMRHK